MINSSLVSAQHRKRLYWTNITNISQPKDLKIVLKDIIEDDFINACSIRGRRIVEGISQDFNKNIPILQYLEIRENDGKSNCLTTVIKDNLLTNKNKSECPPITKLCNVNPSGRGMNGNVYSIDGKSPTVTTNKGEGSKISGLKLAGIANFKGINEQKRVYDISGKSSTLNTCGGGNREPKILTNEIFWRKLTPLECERLQTFSDNYTDGVSNTQRYKMLGNAFTVDVIAHILQFIEGFGDNDSK